MIAQINLVSDELDEANPDYSNTGVTLPYGADASHNATLSPIFITRAGIVYSTTTIVNYYGKGGYLRAATSKADTAAYYVSFNINLATILPNNESPRSEAFSLRCLVSTNNG